jgi:hypothetical protein
VTVGAGVSVGTGVLVGVMDGVNVGEGVAVGNARIDKFEQLAKSMLQRYTAMTLFLFIEHPCVLLI